MDIDQDDRRCKHVDADIIPLRGNYNRGPVIAEKCNGCGQQWNIKPDGRRQPVEVQGVIGAIMEVRETLENAR